MIVIIKAEADTCSLDKLAKLQQHTFYIIHFPKAAKDSMNILNNLPKKALMCVPRWCSPLAHVDSETLVPWEQLNPSFPVKKACERNL